MGAPEPVAGLSEDAKAMLHDGPGGCVRTNAPSRAGFALVCAGTARPALKARAEESHLNETNQNLGLGSFLVEAAP